MRLKDCGLINARCPEIKRENCDGCKMMETYLEFRQQALFIDYLEMEAKSDGSKE